MKWNSFTVPTFQNTKKSLENSTSVWLYFLLLNISARFPEQMSLAKLEIRISNANLGLVSLKAAMETDPWLTWLSTKAPSEHTILMISTQFTTIWVRHGFWIAGECAPRVFIPWFSMQNEANTLQGERKKGQGRAAF